MSDEVLIPEVIVERACADCGEVFEGPASGPKSANWQLGSHRYRKHGVTSSRPKSRPKQRANAPSDGEFSDRPAIAVVRDIASEIGNRKGVPTADDLTNGLGRGLGLVSIAVASYAAETDPEIPEGAPGNDERDRLVDYLSLSDKAAKDVMRPLGKAFAPTRLNRRFGRQIVDNVDAVASVAELVTLGVHWRNYFRHRRQLGDVATSRAADVFAPVAAPQPPLRPSPAMDVASTPPVVTSPAPTSGVVVTREMIEAAQRNGRVS